MLKKIRTLKVYRSNQSKHKELKASDRNSNTNASNYVAINF